MSCYVSDCNLFWLYRFLVFILVALTPCFLYLFLLEFLRRDDIKNIRLIKKSVHKEPVKQKTERKCAFKGMGAVIFQLFG